MFMISSFSLQSDICLHLQPSGPIFSPLSAYSLHHSWHCLPSLQQGLFKHGLWSSYINSCITPEIHERNRFKTCLYFLHLNIGLLGSVLKELATEPPRQVGLVADAKLCAPILIQYSVSHCALIFFTESIIAHSVLIKIDNRNINPSKPSFLDD